MNLELKASLIKQLDMSQLAQTDSAEWRKRPDKIKNEIVLEEAARAIARKKLKMAQLVTSNRELIYDLEVALKTQANRYTENMKLMAQKNQLENQLNRAKEEGNLGKEKLNEELAAVQRLNVEISQDIEQMTQSKTSEVANIKAKIEALKLKCDETQFQTRQEKDLRLKNQRAASTAYHMSSSLTKAQAQTAKKQKKLEILLRLLSASRDHLSTSISHKSKLLNQTQEAARKMRDLTEQLISEEQAFYEEKDSDTMLTPPYLQVKRRPRN